jgi:hypothetical protein
MAGSYGIETFPDSNGPLGTVTKDPELAVSSRASSPAFPNGGVYFPGGVEALATRNVNWPGYLSGHSIP